MARERTQASRRTSQTVLCIFALLLFISPVASDTSGLTYWTVSLNPAEFSTYAACVSAHLGNTSECWLYWTETTVTLPPDTVVSDVLVSVTGTLISALPEITASTDSSISSPAVQTSTATITVQVPVGTGSLSATAKKSPASRPEASNTLLFMVLFVVFASSTALQLVGT